MKKRFGRTGTSFILVLLMSAVAVSAADYPTKPVTIIVSMAPGGSRDVLARVFASVLEKHLGQPIVILNKPGATGMIGGLAGAQATPDGYTLTSTSASDTCVLEWEIANGRKPLFSRHDFVTIASLNLSPSIVIVPSDSPWKRMADLINDARAKPGHYAFCSGGLYGVSHIPSELLTRALGLKCRHVPYTGGGPCINAVVGKHVDFATQYPSSSISLIKGNKIRALAVQGEKRLKSLPDVPTVKELGIDAIWYQWVGISAPKKTPMAIVERLREVSKKVLEDPAYVSMIEKLGDEVQYMIGDELAKYWDNESERVAKIMVDLAKDAPKK